MIKKYIKNVCKMIYVCCVVHLFDTKTMESQNPHIEKQILDNISKLKHETTSLPEVVKNLNMLGGVHCNLETVFDCAFGLIQHVLFCGCNNPFDSNGKYIIHPSRAAELGIEQDKQSGAYLLYSSDNDTLQKLKSYQASSCPVCNNEPSENETNYKKQYKNFYEEDLLRVYSMPPQNLKHRVDVLRELLQKGMSEDNRDIFLEKARKFNIKHRKLKESGLECEHTMYVKLKELYEKYFSRTRLLVPYKTICNKKPAVRKQFLSNLYKLLDEEDQKQFCDFFGNFSPDAQKIFSEFVRAKKK